MHYEKSQEFFLFILYFRSYMLLQHLFIYHYKDNGLQLYDNFYQQCIFVPTFLQQMQQIFVFSKDSPYLFVNGIIFSFSKLIIFIARSLKDSQNFLIRSSPLYTSYLFSTPSNVHIVNIEYPHGICLPTFVVDFSELFLRPPTLLMRDSRSA